MRLRCPHCRQKYEIDEQFAGQEIECVSCGKLFRLPAAKVPAAAATPAAAKVPVPGTARRHAGRGAKRKTRDCPVCGEAIPVDAVKCGHCGEFSAAASDLPVRRKSRRAYVVLGLLLGGIGAHNFYLGRSWGGAEKIILTLAGASLIPTRWWALGFLLLLVNALWILLELLVDPNNAEELKQNHTRQCVAVGIFILLLIIISLAVMEYYAISGPAQ